MPRPTDMPPPTVTIFGGGITGLTVAHELAERGWSVTLFEAETDLRDTGQPALGGLAKSQWSFDPDPTSGAPSVADPFVPTITFTRKPGQHTDLLQQFAPGDSVKFALLTQRLETIHPAIPHLKLRYADKEDPADPFADNKRVAERLAEHLEKSYGARRITIESSVINVKQFEVSTVLEPKGLSTPHLLPGEHGFRFFPGLYRHLFDTLRRIPLKSSGGRYSDSFRTVYDNLLPTEGNWLVVSNTDARPDSSAAADANPVHFPRRLRKSIREYFDVFSSLQADLGYVARDLDLLTLRFFKYMSSCRERRKEEFEALSWRQFLGLDDCSAVCQNDMDVAPQLLAAMLAGESDTRTQGNMATQLLLDPINADERVDSTLNGPTTLAWFDPWSEYLREQGVKIEQGRLADFGVAGKQIVPVLHRPDGSRIDAPKTDYYVLAIPFQAWSANEYALIKSWEYARDQLGAKPDHIGRLHTWLEGQAFNRPTENYPHPGLLVRDLTGVQFYLDSDVFPRSGHSLYLDSEWRLSSISQTYFWQRRRAPSDGYRGLISVDIGSFITGKRTFKDVKRTEVPAEVWRQIAPKGLEDSTLYFTCHIDEHIKYDQDDVFKENRAPFLINGVGEWQHRPGWRDTKTGEPESSRAEDPSQARYQLMPIEQSAPGRWVLAGTFMQTWTRATTMESANESGRHAVNTLLAAETERHSMRRWMPCAIWNPEDYEHPDLVIWRELDEKLFTWPGGSLPHFLDILELDALPEGLLDCTGEMPSTLAKLLSRMMGGF
jgi:hypothetical protein